MTDYKATQTYTPGRRAAAFWFSDGLVEIVFGLLIVSWAAWGILAGSLWMPRWVLWGTWLLLYGFFYSCLMGYPKIIDFLKSRITYPRAGYAQPPAEPLPDQDLLHDMFGRIPPDPLITLRTARSPGENISKFRVHTLVLIFVAHVIGIIGHAWPDTHILAILMPGFALLLFLLNCREAHPYPWHSVIPVALAGLLPIFVKFFSAIAMVFPMLVFGLWMLLRGLWILMRFLNLHRKIRTLEHGRA